MYPLGYSPKSRAMPALGGIVFSKPPDPKTWNLSVRITAPGQTYTVDINAGTGPEIRIDWGDGIVESFTSTGQKTHTYQLVKTHTVKISGRFLSDGNIRLGSNAADRARIIGTSAIPFIPGLANFNSTFLYCTGLTGPIPQALFWQNPQVSTNGFNATFAYCTNLTCSIPVDLFRYTPLVSAFGFYATFINCTNLTGSIPVDLFRYTPLVSTFGFAYTFYGCTNLTGSIPVDLFRYTTQVSAKGFYATFADCTNLTGSIPTDLFRYTPLVSTFGFYDTFANCTNLTGSIPTDLFRYTTQVSTNGFYATFSGCSKLTDAPALLFKYNTACTSFAEVFWNCNKLQLNANLFFDTGEESIRFLNQSVDFTNAMRIGTFTGTQGEAPALWSCDFGSGTPTKTACFSGHSTSSVSNFADIPAEWK